MTISRLLGATMIAGALATGAAAAGIAGAAAAPSESGTKTSQSAGTSSTTTTTPSTGTGKAPAAPKSGEPGKHPCPNMGAHQSGSAAQGPPASGAGYPAAPAGATAQ